MAEERLPESSDVSGRANRLRQRLVGAAVLIALAVLLLPIWLDGSGLRAPRVEPVPPPPKVAQPKTVEVPKPAPQQLSRLQHPPATLMPPPSDASKSGADQAAGSASQPSATAPSHTRSQSAPQSAAEPSPKPESKTALRQTPKPQAVEKPVPAKSQPKTPAPQDQSDKSQPDKEAAASKAATTSTGKWVVQLGSFSDELNARGLQKSVSEAGFKVYVEPLFAKKGTVWRVRVGPFATRDEASKATERLRERLGRDGLVMAR